MSDELDDAAALNYTIETSMRADVHCSVVIILAAAAAAAVAMLVVNEALLKELIGVLQSTVVVPLMMLIKLN